jgi:hypothetical protein
MTHCKQTGLSHEMLDELSRAIRNHLIRDEHVDRVAGQPFVVYHERTPRGCVSTFISSGKKWDVVIVPHGD